MAELLALAQVLVLGSARCTLLEDVSAEALWPERGSGGFSRGVKDLHMNEEKETQF